MNITSVEVLLDVIQQGVARGPPLQAERLARPASSRTPSILNSRVDRPRGPTSRKNQLTCRCGITAGSPISPFTGLLSPSLLSSEVSVLLLISRAVMFYAWKVWWALNSKTKRKKLEAVQSENLQRANRSSQKSLFFVKKTTHMRLIWASTDEY